MLKPVDILKQSHPAHDDPVGYLRTVTIIGVLLFLILWLFTPFHFRHFPEDQLLVMALLYAGTAYVTMLLGLLWIRLFPQVFVAKNWTLGKELMLIGYLFTTIALAFWVLTRFLAKWQSVGQSFMDIWGVVAATCILPYLLATALKHISLLKQQIKSTAYNQTLLRKRKPIASHQWLSIPNLLVPLSIEEIIYVESDGNHLKIHAVRLNTLQHYTVRDTLKRFETDNANFPTLFRCHRMYLVNLVHVTGIAGNASNCVITFRDPMPPIPVSRSRVTQLKRMWGSSSGQGVVG